MKHTVYILKISILIFVFVPFVHTDTITIHNRTTTDLYVAIYYEKQGDSNRATTVQSLKKYSSLSMERPARKLLYDRELVLSLNEADLKPHLSKETFNQLSSKNVGTLQGHTFYIAKEDGYFKGYTVVEWEIIKPIIETAGWLIEETKEIGGAIITTMSETVRNSIGQTLLAIRENPYRNKSAQVRVGNQLSSGERDTVNQRLKVVKNALKNKLEISDQVSYVPKISFIASGGGYRAMSVTFGFLTGAQKIGLLDCATWITSLSGSTWALGTWLATATKYQKATGKQLSISEFSQQFATMIDSKGLGKLSPTDIKLLSNSILVQAVLGRPVTLVNLYGILLANRLLANFGNKKHQTYITEQIDLIQNGQWPIPIYTAVRGEAGLTKEQLNWYEFTPWEVGGAWLGIYAPTFSYGRKFDQGRSREFGPPQDLGFNLGTFGSAFAATVEEIYHEVGEKIDSDIVRKIIKKVIIKPAGQKRLTWAEAFNFTKGMNQSPIKDLKTIKLVDAGLAFNLPYPPVSGERPERKSDILIFLDVSSPIKGAPALKESEAYARRKRLKFPIINYEGIDKRTISIFKNEQDPEVPVVIYMPRINDQTLWKKLEEPEFAPYKGYLKGFDVEKCVIEDYCKTFNLKYTKKQAEQLNALGEFNMRVNQKVIFDEIRALIERKS